jgi:hypothetical protein
MVNLKEFKNKNDFALNLLKSLAKKNHGIYSFEVYQEYKQYANIPVIGKTYARINETLLTDDDIILIAKKHQNKFIYNRGSQYLNGKYGKPDYIIVKDYFMRKSKAIELRNLRKYYNNNIQEA